MLDWLQSYWGAMVAIVAFLIALKTLVEYGQKELEKHAPLRDWVRRWLVVPSYHDAYRDWLGRQLERLHARMGGLWSGTALAWCLAIAFAYPAGLLLASYGLGGPGTVGTTQFLPRLGGWRQPVLGFGLLILMVGVGLVVAFERRINRHLLGGIEVRLERRRVGDPRRALWLYRVGGAIGTASLSLAATIFFALPGAVASVAGAVAVALAAAGAAAVAGFRFPVGVAVAGAALGVVAAAEVITGASVATGALYVAVAGAVAGAGAVVLAGTVVEAVARFGALAEAVAVTGAVALAIAGAVMLLAGVTPLSLAFLLFLVVLPVTNALLDWPSWAISRWLGHDLHDLMSGRSRWLGRVLRRLFRGFWQAASFAVHILLDLAAAVMLLVLLAILLPFLIQAFNDAVLATGGEPPLALHGFLTRAVQRPWPDGAWALAMLLTTLIPTALHAGAAIVMMLLLPLQPAGWRARLATGLAAADDSERAWAVARASWLMVLTPLLAGVLVVGLGYGLVALLAAVWRPVAQLLLEAALFGMAQADHLADALGWLPPSRGQ